ncbi:hypothetical protein H1R20_g13421, partial [Candolleomyces eurysporus]
MVPSSFILLSLVGAALGLGNDWKQPCLDGVCFYDLKESNIGAASGTLKIWGSADSITDITTAAGWEILDCKPDSLSQDIRLVCSDKSKCRHLFRKLGAVGKVVRLPESCGKNAFAHISRSWVSRDQSIPARVASRLIKRDGTLPEVQALHIDTDFAAVDASKIGTVHFAIQAATVPGAESLFPSTSRIKGRDESTFVEEAMSSVSGLLDFQWEHLENFTLLDINRTWNVFDQSLTCPPISARARMDVSAQVNVAASVGAAVEGTIIPPKVDDFALIAILNANLAGALNLNAGLTGSISAAQRLYQVAIPGLDFPGILTIGPSFYIDAKASATLDINADLNVGLNYKIEKASMVFPPTSKYAVKQGGAFQFVDTPLKLSATPSFQTNGRVEAHLIPGIDLGINVLNGAGVASVYLNVDAGAQMNLALEGQATGEVIVGRGETREIEEAGDTVVKREPTPVAVAPTATATGSAGFSGCFDISTGLDVVAGATAKLFNIFDKSTTYTLFSRDWELYQKCFGAQTKREELDYYARSVPEPVALNKRLVCPIAGLPPLQSLVDSMILASAVKQV